jgi:hypothetical protein
MRYVLAHGPGIKMTKILCLWVSLAGTAQKDYTTNFDQTGPLRMDSNESSDVIHDSIDIISIVGIFYIHRN